MIFFFGGALIETLLKKHTFYIEELINHRRKCLLQLHYAILQVKDSEMIRFG